MSMPGVMANHPERRNPSPSVRRGIEDRRGESLTTALYRRFLENCCTALDAIAGPEVEPPVHGNVAQESTKGRLKPAWSNISVSAF